jgi:hypothetical protein
VKNSSFNLLGFWQQLRASAMLSVALLFSACAGPMASDAGELGIPVMKPVPLCAETLPAWREYILPNGDDLAYASIPWHVTFGEGMDAARAEGKPLLMWAMNGHPLGCT